MGPTRHIWQLGFYDLAVWTEKKRIQKLRCMHRNPAKRELVAKSERTVVIGHTASEEKEGQPSPDS